MRLPAPTAARRRRVPVLVLLLATLAGPAGGAEVGDLPTSPLTIVTPEHRHDFTVEVAASAEQRARGLMFRTALPVDRGMLFDFGREQEVSMWMRNTLIPLDMLFIDRAGGIRKIEANTKPLSLETISSEVPVIAVLELAGGTSNLLGIGPGDRVIHPMFDGAGQPEERSERGAGAAPVARSTSRTPE